MNTKCPMDKPNCDAMCAWFMAGKCAMVRIAEGLARIELQAFQPEAPKKREKKNA